MSELPEEVWTIIFSYLDFESLQKKTVLVCKDWYEIIRSNSNLSGHLVLHPPMKKMDIDYLNSLEFDLGPEGQAARHFDYNIALQTASLGKYSYK